MRAWPSLLVAGALVAAASGASGQVSTRAFDLLAVLKGMYYPVQVMAYCFKEVQQNAKYQAVGQGWLMRNQDLIGKLEALAKTEKISNDLRVQSDKETLDAIKKTVAGQSDGIAYCGLISSVIDGGGFDIAVRDDFKQPLKRIFPAP